MLSRKSSSSEAKAKPTKIEVKLPGSNQELPKIEIEGLPTNQRLKDAKAPPITLPKLFFTPSLPTKPAEEAGCDGRFLPPLNPRP